MILNQATGCGFSYFTFQLALGRIFLRWKKISQEYTLYFFTLTSTKIRLTLRNICRISITFHIFSIAWYSDLTFYLHLKDFYILIIFLEGYKSYMIARFLKILKFIKVFGYWNFFWRTLNFFSLVLVIKIVWTTIFETHVKRFLKFKISKLLKLFKF